MLRVNDRIIGRKRMGGCRGSGFYVHVHLQVYTVIVVKQHPLVALARAVLRTFKTYGDASLRPPSSLLGREHAGCNAVLQGL